VSVTYENQIGTQARKGGHRRYIGGRPLEWVTLCGGRGPRSVAPRDADAVSRPVRWVGLSASVGMEQCGRRRALLCKLTLGRTGRSPPCCVLVPDNFGRAHRAGRGTLVPRGSTWTSMADPPPGVIVASTPPEPDGSAPANRDDCSRWRAGGVFRGFADDAVELGPQPLLAATDQRPELGVHCLGTKRRAGVPVVAHRVSPPCHDRPCRADVSLLV